MTEILRDTRADQRGGLALPWRRYLKRSIVTLLAAKLAALILLKVLFFSGDNRVEVTPNRVEQQLRIPRNHDLPPVQGAVP